MKLIIIFLVFMVLFEYSYSQNEFSLNFNKDKYIYNFNNSQYIAYMKFKIRFTNKSNCTYWMTKPLPQPNDVSKISFFDINYPSYIYNGVNFDFVMINNSLYDYNDTIFCIEDVVVNSICPKPQYSSNNIINDKYIKLRRNSFKNLSIKVPCNKMLPKGEYSCYTKINIKNNFKTYNVTSDTIIVIIR